MDQSAIGSQLRARRAAAGRTVASVAADAGLSVPYIANLENGRGNPTITALSRLAEALGMRLAVTLVPLAARDGDGRQAAARDAEAGPPASLVRFSRSARFRQAVRTIAGAHDAEAGELSAGLVTALAALAHAVGRDPGEADWSRILDALLLVALHPAD
ncbi:MAG TPA: helix-turn-helix transcriptional regulator [Trebonia sp.]|jgi:transcriptional regulator with XRE-family HTH domain